MHRPVLLKEVIALLNIVEGGFYFDGTLGLGGHAEAIVNQASGVTVVGMDRDEKALKLVKDRLHSHVGKHLFLYHGNFKDFDEEKRQFPRSEFDGALLDLGFSSFQLDDPKRGFSFQKEGPLDMRMDSTHQTVTAAELVNTLGEKELATLFFTYGEERFSRRIAKMIVERRSQKPFRTTLELSNLIAARAPLWTRSRKIHPATRVFQALRIAVNDELEGLETALTSLLRGLRNGGRLAVISFHSLEDRIVKRSFIRFENPCVCPHDFPQCACGRKPMGRRVTKKPVVPSSAEVLANPRSRSAKLRVIERVCA